MCNSLKYISIQNINGLGISCLLPGPYIYVFHISTDHENYMRFNVLNELLQMPTLLRYSQLFICSYYQISLTVNDPAQASQ
jgi:hypothetical protein